MNLHAFETVSGEVHVYNVTDLWKHTELYPVVNLPCNYCLETFMEFYSNFDEEDWGRVANADLSYPIIYNPTYGVVDGCHRIVKAMKEGLSTIPAKILRDYPKPLKIFSSLEEYDAFDFGE